VLLCQRRHSKIGLQGVERVDDTDHIAGPVQYRHDSLPGGRDQSDGPSFAAVS
jgi:hypothetical protein